MPIPPVVRPVNGLASLVKAVNVIPGATEFGYDTVVVTEQLGFGRTVHENRNQLSGEADFPTSLEALAALCPNLDAVGLVVSWFGDDLRCGDCTVAPRVETAVKVTTGAVWSVAGLTRDNARVVSLANGTPAYGGTPSDDGVKRAIALIKSYGWKVLFYPFAMMDIAGGNALPNPLTGAAGQPTYPWRGRITCDPAPGVASSPDGMSDAATQVGAFFGSITAAEIAAAPGIDWPAAPDPGFDAGLGLEAGAGFTYAGPAEWSWRRLVLHYATLCASAGGVDAFLIGSELAALTRVRSAPGIYPAVAKLVALAADAKAVLGATTKVSYAADWTEYGAHVIDGGAELRFPLDPLWASADIDFVGIDSYMPLADWRDGDAHLDASVARSIYDLAYLGANVASGEDFDWYYPDDASRLAQTRVPITDGAYGKPFVFRAKDLVGWWSNPHVERVGGVELASPTAWVPQGKPIWLTETGVPAIDKGANQPNVFPDAKSSENATPYFSAGNRDDLIQARALTALIQHFDPGAAGFLATANPTSSVYDGPMLDPARIFLWAWDARPYPAFPDLLDVWADGASWHTGHWLTGRLEGAQLDKLAAAVLADFGGPAADCSALDGFVDGYVVDAAMSAREALDPLAELFGFDLVASGGTSRFAPRQGRSVATLGVEDIVPASDGTLVNLTRQQETELPREMRLSFIDGEDGFRQATAASRRLAGASERQSSADIPVVLPWQSAAALADAWLAGLWAARDGADFALRPSLIAIEPGDIVTLDVNGAAREFRVTSIADTTMRKVTAESVDPQAGSVVVGKPALAAKPPPMIASGAGVVILDLPVAWGDPAPLQYMAVSADPWPGAFTVWRSSDGASFAPFASATIPAILGRTISTLGPGPVARWDMDNTVDVTVAGGHLTSADDMSVLGGANRMALRGPDGAYEIIGFANAELIGDGSYRLSRLLRGLAGSEPLAARGLDAGALAVVLDDALVPLSNSVNDLGARFLWRVGPAGTDSADARVVALAANVTGLALAPFPPVRPRAVRDGSGVTLTWIRRGRISSDGWEQAEIPLGEETEAYQVDVLDGAGATLRTLACVSPTVLYAAADEASDFGSPQAALSLRIAQMSAAVGRGAPLMASVVVL